MNAPTTSLPLLPTTAPSASAAPAAAGRCEELWLLPALLLHDRPVPVAVGHGFEVVLVPGPLAAPAVERLDRIAPDMVGAVFTVDGWSWGFLLPPGSQTGLDWTGVGTGVDYRAHGCVVLPPARGSGWIRRHPGGRLLTPPLPLHAALTATPTATGPDRALRTRPARPPPTH
ncbi:hypothetical protein VSR01_28365 [Actinacidiphila sp. DG2A-62]|uniref:hypothetical protein n=1 Tax=Actinacidiphila sp. DG2A-62 TaxID=3108821 RepID=UPI002DB777B0|nr:hypothetical protein [Actinacidiphila sp. DG2A-62]MEC3997205.1 hypothetical protein [Actinacidiphila sp. DG2A-62]